VNRLAQRLQEAEEQRSALDRERQALTAAISHDLRTPLASVRAMVEALDDHVVEDATEVDRYYAAMRREIERLDRMIDDLFELARLDAGALELDRHTVALEEIAADVVDAMQAQARRKGVALALHVAGSPRQLALDGDRMGRVAANLIRNALEHTPDGGRVDVSVFSDDGHVGLRVSDSGEGIDASDLGQIWRRFYRAERSRGRASDEMDGAGLGLAIVRGFVEAHGGAVAVESVRGEGATFTVRLPMKAVRADIGGT
jgi:signal transduction histidine kinase